MVRVPGPGVTTMTIPMPSKVKPNTILRYRLACRSVRITLSTRNRRSRNPPRFLKPNRASCYFDAAIRENDSKEFEHVKDQPHYALAGQTHGADNGLRQVRHSKGFGRLEKKRRFLHWRMKKWSFPQYECRCPRAQI
jgi:hypothetical protein